VRRLVRLEPHECITVHVEKKIRFTLRSYFRPEFH